MPGMSTQFHALPSEIADLLGGLFDDPDVHVLRTTGRSSYQEIDRPVVPGDGPVSFAFTVHRPMILGASTAFDFQKHNPEGLYLEIGGASAKGLEESWLQTMATNPFALGRWKKAFRKLKASTTTGAIAVNPTSGATAPMRAHRFTRRAQEAYAEGQPMLPCAGNTIIQFPPPLD